MPSWSNMKYKLPRPEAPSVDAMRKVDQILRNGGSNVYAAKQTGMTPAKIMHYRRMMRGVPHFCGCGERWDAIHSCWWKVNSTLTNPEALDQLRQLRRAKMMLKQTLVAIRERHL